MLKNCLPPWSRGLKLKVLDYGVPTPTTPGSKGQGLEVLPKPSRIRTRPGRRRSRIRTLSGRLRCCLNILGLGLLYFVFWNLDIFWLHQLIS
ncbi:hypothetical protein BRADI_1g19336v3 [Brachypodium distachyon]|uniref:Uncharacterized protein n=1 Tax=Brachypodium distachyon TaxID=15368 RepID=A0A2K2DK36_BRADI|nr:hypothetical protein BRADI_1g19336v3 [Brachypodium distachyon]